MQECKNDAQKFYTNVKRPNRGFKPGALFAENMEATFLYNNEEWKKLTKTAKIFHRLAIMRLESQFIGLKTKTLKAIVACPLSCLRWKMTSW